MVRYEYDGTKTILADAFEGQGFNAPNDAVYSKILSNIEEVKARGGKVIALSNSGDTEIERLADATFTIPDTLDMLTVDRPPPANLPLR